VRAHHPDLEYSGVLLDGDRAEEAAEEPREAGVNEGQAIPRGPDDMEVDAIEHPGNFGFASQG